MVKCFQIQDDLHLIPLEYETAKEAAKKPDAHIWIDIQGLETSELDHELSKLEIQGLAKKLCLEAGTRPGFYPLTNLTFMVLPVVAASEDFHTVEHVAFLVRNNLLLTLRGPRATQLQSTISEQDSAEWLPEGSVAGLVSAFMIVLSLESLKRTSDLRDSIMMLEDRMENEPDSVEMKEISQKRSELLILESVVSSQLPILQALITTEQATQKLESIRQYLNSALANFQATDRSLDWLEGRIEVMSSLVDSLSQERTNRRLGRLTIISIIFLPITFLAGLWGMNFENMPGLTNPLGYPVALTAMFLISIGTYFYFRWKGWFE